MQLSPDEREEKIRPLATARISTRDIERITGIPQSTVVRDLKRINTGPQPIITPDQPDQRDQPDQPEQRRRMPLRPIMITAAALLILAVAIGCVTWLRGDLPTHQPTGYAPIFQYQAPLYLCAGVTLEGYLSDLAPATNGTCPKGWKLLVLQPGT